MINTNYYKFKIPNFITTNISQENDEICANMVINGDNLILTAQTRGNSINGRASCTVQRHTPFIFHTHPGTSYNPPSKEDIEKVFKHKRIKVSVIANLWGLFQIIKTNNNNDDDNDDNDNEYREHSEHRFRTDLVKIKEYIDKINKITVDPEYLKVRNNLGSKPKIYKNMEWNKLSEGKQDIVYENINHINRYLEKYNIRILFTPNDNDEKEYYNIYTK